MTPVLHVQCQHGLGDNIFSRPLVRAATAYSQVYLSTPWPELYEDLPVRFVHTSSTLRTQVKNLRRQSPRRWSHLPQRTPTVKLSYGADFFQGGKNIQRALERLLPLRGQPYFFDLPDMGPSPIASVKPIAVVRPVTTRREWFNPARNPLPEYVRDVARDLMQTHHVVAVADVEAGVEDLCGEMPPFHEGFVHGELSVRPLLALLRAADVVVGGVGWIVPASIALGTRAFIICGGQGGHNAPEKITDPRTDLSRIHFAKPREYCPCTNMRHACRKEIPDLMAQWTRFKSGLRSTCSERPPEMQAC